MRQTATVQDFQAVLARLDRLAERDAVIRAHRDLVIEIAKREGFQRAYGHAVRVLELMTKPKIVEG